jgi:pimeloyl-ACP methyl ester carboxylesterase
MNESFSLQPCVTDQSVAESVGEGPITLFVHGLGDCRHHWRCVVNDPRMHGRRIAYDLAGHGDAPWSADGRYSLARHADDLLAILDRFRGAPVVLVGHSMGGEVALRAATRSNCDVRGVILVDCSFRIEPAISQTLAIEERSAKAGFATRADFVRWLSTNRPLMSDDMRQTIAQTALRRDQAGRFSLKCDPSVYMARLSESGAEEDSWVALAGVHCPILILRGEASSYLSTRTARAMQQHARLAIGQTVAKAGHGIAVENPTGMIDAIVPFLGEILWTPAQLLRVRQ